MNKLTAQMLIDKRACPKGCERYRTLFGDDPVEVSLQNLKKADEVGLDLNWFAEHFAPKESKKVAEEYEANCPLTTDMSSHEPCTCHDWATPENVFELVSKEWKP